MRWPNLLDVPGISEMARNPKSKDLKCLKLSGFEGTLLLTLLLRHVDSDSFRLGFYHIVGLNPWRSRHC